MTPTRTHRRTSRSRIMWAALTGVLVWSLVAPVGALAVISYSWQEGNGTKFAGSKTSKMSATTKSPYTISLKKSSTSVTLKSVVAESIQSLGGGEYLIADANGGKVAVAKSSGTTSFLSSADTTMVTPVWARRSGSETLVVDRDGYRVFIVDSNKSVIWEYGGTKGTGANQLEEPVAASFYGTGNAKGTVLIADGGSGRLLEIKRSDNSVKWQYTAPVSPSSVQRLDGDEVLYSDEGTHQILVVKGSKVSWSFGAKNSQGSDMTHLSGPRSVQRANGVYLVNDVGNLRVLRVTTAKVATVVGTGANESMVTHTSGDGSTIIGTAGATSTSVKTLAYTTDEQKYQTKTLDLGTPGVAKWVTRITVQGAVPTNTKMRATYSINGGSWKSLGALDKQWPKGLKATTLRIRVYQDTTDRSVSPLLTSVSVVYTVLNPMTPESNQSTLNLNRPGFSTLGTGFPNPYGLNASGTAEVTTATVPGFDTGAPTQPTILTGTVFKNVYGAEPPKELTSLLVEPAGVAAAVLLLSTTFALGTAAGPIGAASKTAFDAAMGMIRIPRA